MTQHTTPGLTPPIVHTVYHPPAVGPLPTVVAIHGHGANAFDLLGLAPYLAGGQLLVICPEAEFALQPGTPSYTWFEVASGGRPGERSFEEFERVAGNLRAFIESAVPSYGGDPLRTVVLGFSQGGTLAYRLGLGEPDRYRGIAALSTWLRPEVDPLVDRAQASKLRMIVQHGTEDSMIEVVRARESRDRLVALGVTPEYHEYPMAHEIRPDSMADLNRWLEDVLELPSSAASRA